MSVWDLKTEYNLSYLDARESLLDGFGNLLCENLITGDFIIVHIKDVVNLTTWDYQSVTYDKRIDIKKCIEFIVLCTFIAWDFASCDF